MKSRALRIEEYRKMLGGTENSDEKIGQRIDFLEGLCRNIIRAEIEDYRKKIIEYTRLNAKQQLLPPSATLE